MAIVPAVGPSSYTSSPPRSVRRRALLWVDWSASRRPEAAEPVGATQRTEIRSVRSDDSDSPRPASSGLPAVFEPLGAGEPLVPDGSGFGRSGSDEPGARSPFGLSAPGSPAPGSPAPGSPAPGSPAPGSPARGSPARVRSSRGRSPGRAFARFLGSLAS
ncbi:hypothetical protein GEV43_20095 [Actinomadura sp. J1-007]|nr:hypothetical protein [Actinomadura sp. J1-007]